MVKDKKTMKSFTNYEEVIANSIIESCCFYLHDTLKKKSNKNSAQEDRSMSIRGLYQLVWHMFKLNGIKRDYPSIKTHLHRCLMSKFLEPNLKSLVDSYLRQNSLIDDKTENTNMSLSSVTPTKEKTKRALSQQETESCDRDSNYSNSPKAGSEMLDFSTLLEENSTFEETYKTFEQNRPYSDNISTSSYKEISTDNDDKRSLAKTSTGCGSNIVADNLHYLDGQLERLA